MEDGLYLFGQWVAEVSVTLNLQANDLTQPTTLQRSYANFFNLPDTTALRVLLQNAEQLDAAGRDPYRLIPAFVIEEGETTFTGFAALQSFQGGWKVSMSGAGKNLFDQLGDLKLTDLDLTEYNHPWNLDTIATYAENTEGVVYPCVDYGTMEAGVMSQDTLTPAVYATTLIRTMLHQCGYRPVGDWLLDPEIRRIILPFVEDEPKAYDAQWVIDRQARVTVTGVLVLPPFGDFNVLLQLNRDSEPLNGWVDGKQDNYKATTYRYVCDVAMRLRCQAFQQFTMKVDFGAVEALLIVEKNGINVAQAYVSESGPFNQSLVRPTVLQLDERIDCRAGDQIQIRLIIRKRTKIAQWLKVGFVNEESTYASFEPDATVHMGDTWPVARNLPDMSCADLLRAVALMTSGTYEINIAARTVTLHTLNDVLSREAIATDLSHCIEESQEPENAVIIAPYGQKNRLKWKPLEDKTLEGYGDGLILCGAQNIPLETTLFELPFAAVVDSPHAIAGYGAPPRIETRTVSGTGANIQVQKKASPPRLLLVEPSRPVTVIVNEITPELTVRPKKVQLTSCWWHTRPAGLKLDENDFSLAFDRPKGTTNLEQTQIQRWFKPLLRILRRPRQFGPSAYLRPVEVANMNLYAPVRLRRVRAGSIDVNDQYFYLNKVNNYQSGQMCTLSLIAY